MLNIYRSSKEVKQREKLGEKYTSSITDRRFATEFFKELNPKIDLDTIESIYSIGNYKRTNFSIYLIEKCLKAKLFNLMNSIVSDMPMVKDEMGYVPIGDYVEVYIWKTKNNEFYAQLKEGTLHLPFHPPERRVKPFIVKTIKIGRYYPKLISRRSLIYPIE
ncbi:MAG: hypothetical protein ACI9N1_001739 [Flavobacteriales bacterium]|jgi:hypothetical protein